jgi:hypothetical protein
MSNLWIHIPPEVFLNPPKRLMKKDPRAVKRYNKRAKKELLQLKIPHKLFNLEGEMHYPPTSNKISRFNAQARIQHDVRTGAANKCRKLKMGKDQWSPKLQKLRDTISLWKL